MKFGHKIRQLRNDKNLTQPQLAESMGIEQSYLSKLENDKSMPSNDVLNRILDVFDIELGDLVKMPIASAKAPVLWTISNRAPEINCVTCPMWPTISIGRNNY